MTLLVRDMAQTGQKSVICLSTGEVPAPPETGNDILLGSDGKIQMQYVVSDPDPDVRYRK